MDGVLVAYTTNAGSTAEVAQAVGEEIARAGAPVHVRPLDEVAEIVGYRAVVVGAPMIMGWHRAARRFVKMHQGELARVKVAYFLAAMSLTQTDHHLGAVPLAVDPGLAKPPRQAGRLSFRERFCTLDEYVGPVLKAAPEVKPLGVGVFAGKLDPARLSWWQRLFVLRVVGAQPGEYRNWPFIREWARRLGEEIGR